MAANKLFDQGIKVTGSFSAAGAFPVDAKTVVETISERDDHVTQNRAYEGMLVYVKADKKTYQYTNNAWKEFGFNDSDFKSRVVDNLTTDSADKALSARQGKVLNDSIIMHQNDSLLHFSSVDRQKLSGIETNANRYVHPSYTAKTATLVKVGNDTTGHVVTSPVTKADITALGIPGQDTTYGLATTTANGLMSQGDKSKLDGIAAGANNYVHPTTAGNKHIPTGGGADQYLKWSSSGTAVWSTIRIPTYADMEGATASAAGTSGLVPAPTAGKQTSFLRGDGTWAVPTDTKYSVATASANGLMSKEDKVVLDDLSVRPSVSTIQDVELVSKSTEIRFTSIDRNILIEAGRSENDDTIWINANIFGYPLATAGDKQFSDGKSTREYIENQLSKYALKSDISSMYKHKGSVTAVANLPKSGNTAGDVYNVTATGMNYVWTGSEWDALGEVFSIDSITNAELDAICV